MAQVWSWISEQFGHLCSQQRPLLASFCAVT